ncbi:ComEC/Rec2 family competence protein [Clostridiaceae bacterium UIB06]|uniref:ComEC/Rec2 family competence protein n=1 Tax=Clostridium thailandense TaxID=2794346 RepID=A0A949TPJ4_9CLOT|nr:ComEC/Rec2 family competence protein [Clostridium thailandense]MBV7273042.1 ComEC/Rec2 family competence protein [Clostridium thailandense]MCH5135706.1 ComEC/Rec2 family competence protein [Clostridiaceae bacterium UIB06]
MKRPLIYYFVSVFIGCLSSLLLYENALIGAVITASFFAVLFFTLNKNFFILNMLFLIVGALSFVLYFNIKIYNPIELRITENKGYYCLAEYKGRKILVNGKVNKIEEGKLLKVYGKFENNKDYTSGIVGTYKIDKYEVCNKDMLYYLYEIKRNIYLQFKQKLGEDKSSVIMALCYGDAGYLTKSQKNDFKKLGVFHAISVSGFHMAIIYKVLEFTIGLKFAVVTSFLYLIFTGMQASTARAFIMILAFKSSKLVFKNYDSLSSLGLAGVILLIMKPYYIMDIGFMLSFLATLGILLYYKKTLRILYRLPKALNESLSITLSSQIFSVPYTAFNIQNFSGGFILGNILLLPMYSAIVILGNLALLMCSIPVIFDIFSKLLNFVLTATEGANYLILKICPPITHLTYLDGFALMAIYLGFLLYVHGHVRFKYFPVFVLVLMMWQNYSFLPYIYYVPLSQGEGIIVEYKMNKTMICNYDQSSAKEIIELKEKMNIDKIITNPKQKLKIDIGSSLHLNITPYGERKFFNININEGQSEFIPVNSNNKDNSATKALNQRPENNFFTNKEHNIEENLSLYVIIFRKIIKVY